MEFFSVANLSGKSLAPQDQGALLATLFDAAPLGMVVADEQGRVTLANSAFYQLLGLSDTTVAEVSIDNLVHVEDAAAARLQFERLCRGEVTSYRGEHRLRHADGSPVWVMVNASVVSDADAARQVILQFNNIELQKRAEEALAYSENRWNFALESARQGVWDHDIRNDTMFYSRMWRVMRGIPADEEVSGDREAWLERLHPDDLAHVTNNVDRQDQGDQNFDALEYRERTREGNYIWILSRGRPVEWDEHGNPTRTLGTDTDITALKTLQQDLAAEKERLSVTLHAMTDGVISTDAEGRVVFINPAAEHLLGLAASDAHGRLAHEIFRLRSESTGEVLPNPVCSCLERGQAVRLDDDCLLWGRDGRVRDIRCTASPVGGHGDKISGALLVFQDVTESRSLQRQLAHSASHDMLTGIPNRAAFDRALRETIAGVQSSERQHALIYLDLDRFKPVNDTAGHAAGDGLLKLVAQTIRGACRSSDFAARIGGDEFAVLLHDCPMGSGVAVANKIVRQIGALQFNWEGRTYRIGASAGITLISTTPPSAVGFLGEADAACYAAKAAGRGCAVSFTDIPTTPTLSS